MSGTITITCALCGEPHTKPVTVGRRPRFCDACRPLRGRFAAYQTVQNERRREETAIRKAKPQCCEMCGSTFTGSKRRFCSEACRTQAAIQRRDPDVYEPRSCLCCGAMFAPSYPDRRRAYCSEACGKRMNRRLDKQSRRAQQRATAVERIDPIVVFERDGWTCVICGVSTPSELRGTTDPRAPEPDHDVPLGRGGTHTYANMNCTCRACNQAKGLKTLEEYKREGAGSKA